MKKNLFILLSTFFALISCDKDYNTIGSDIVGDGHYNMDLLDVSDISTYSAATGAVQTNNLPINALGVYNDDFYGTETASFVTQLEIPTLNYSFGYEKEVQIVDSLYLYVPYFSSQTATATGNEANTFSLDSIYGNVNNSFNLEIYENKYTLSTLDVTDPTVNQKYYSNDIFLVENAITIAGGSPLNTSSNTLQNSQFKFLANEYLIYETDANGNWLNSSGSVTSNPDERVVKERVAPGMWINLDESFRTKILSTTSSDFLNNNNFKEFFKGLYFKATSNGQDAAMAQLDFSKGYVVMQYHSRSTERPQPGESGYATYETDYPLVKKTLRLSFGGNTINFFQHSPSTNYSNAMTEASQSGGQQTLVLKGHEGAGAFIELFENAADLDNLRNEDYLINDAVLTIYAKNVNANNPNRIYLYDATNNLVIADYNADTSTSGVTSKYNKYVFGGIREDIKDAAGNIVAHRYRIRLTSYIKALLNPKRIPLQDNLKFGLTVTENINVPNFASIENPNGEYLNDLFPVASIMNPLGVVLHGHNSSATYTNADGETVKMKLNLQIYYTKPN